MSNMINTSNVIAENLFHVLLHVTFPSGTRQDSRGRDLVQEETGCVDGNYTKRIFGDHIRVFNAVRTGAIRAIKPHGWKDSGEGYIVPKRFIGTVSEAVEEQSVKFWAAVADFKSKYEDIKAERLNALGSLFDSKDYPDIDALKFSFHLMILPVPSSHSLLSIREIDDVVETVRDSINKYHQEISRRGALDMLRRLNDGLSSLSEACEKIRGAQGDEIEKADKALGKAAKKLRDVAMTVDTLNVLGDADVSLVYNGVVDICDTLYDASVGIDDVPNILKNTASVMSEAQLLMVEKLKLDNF